MDTRQSGPLNNAAAIGLAWQAAASNLQLLAMLDVVHDWSRSDAVSVRDCAEQTETLAAFLVSLRMGDPPSEVDRIRTTLDQVVQRAERLAQLAPVQVRDAATGTALANALRRLASACRSLNRAVEPKPVDAGAGCDEDGPDEGADTDVATF